MQSILFILIWYEFAAKRDVFKRKQKQTKGAKEVSAARH